MPIGAVVDVLNTMKKVQYKVYDDCLLTNICFRGEVVQFRASISKFAAIV